MASGVQLMHLAGAADGAGTRLGPCAVLLQFDGDRWPAVRLLAIGTGAEVAAHPAAKRPDLVTVDATDSVAIPGLANAHSHLDLTHIGPRGFPLENSFVDWVDMVRAGRRTEVSEIRASVHDGASRCLAGGVVAVGDIAGVFGIAALEALSQTPLVGLSGIELFGIGRRQQAVIRMLDSLQQQAEEATGASGRLGWTWQPHAPYSVGPALYREAAIRCARRGVPMMTHLAETGDERRFVAFGDGRQREMLERLGAWDETCAQPVGRQQSPVEYLSDVLVETRTITAHVNDASDADLAVLGASGVSVAYCPRASAYFRQPEVFGRHRYRDMLDAGINVALGTDSIINLPAAQSDRLSTLDDARLLFRRDGLDPETALGMATWRGAEALGLDSAGFSLRASGLPRWLYGLSTVEVADSDTDAARRVMESEHIPKLVRLTGGPSSGGS